MPGWYDAKVVDTAGAGKKRNYLVHYRGWKSSSDEWVRSAQLRSHDAPKPERCCRPPPKTLY